MAVKVETKPKEKPAAPAAPESKAQEAAPVAEKPVVDADVVSMAGDVSVGGEAPDEAAPAEAGEKPEVTKSPTQASPAKSEAKAEEPVGERTEPSAKSEPKKTVVINGKEFDSAEAALAYARGKLEKGDDLLDAVAAVQEAKKSDDPDPAELIFEDPKRAIEILRKQITEEIRAEDRARRKKESDDAAQAESYRRHWDEFYTQNPELKSAKAIVQEELAKLMKENDKMPIAEAKKRLAENSRARMKEIAAAVTPAKELSNDPAITGGTTEADVKEEANKPVVVESFLSQVKGLRR